MPPHYLVRGVRIASLIPSGTDIAVALGLAESIVGISHECDNPRTTGRPVLTSAYVAAAPEAPPGEVDKAVVDAVTAGEPLYATDMDLLRSLSPDIVLAQNVCDVCAVPGRAVRDDLPENVKLIELSAKSLSGLEDDLLNVGEATGTEEQARSLIDRMRAIRFEVMGRIGGRRRPPVLTLEWGDPPFVGGHWVPEIVGTAGGIHLLVEPGDPSVRSTWEAVGELQPEFVVFMPCGYSLDAALNEARTHRGRIPAAEWWAVDAVSLYSRCTPAAASHGLHVMAGILHPEICPPPDYLKARKLR